jgi:putative transposase
MPGRRIKLEGSSHYHVISRIVDRRMRLDDQQKERFRELMRGTETFSGVEILTYAIMGNHFHILLHVPTREAVAEPELIRRLHALYTEPEVRERLARWDLWRKQGLPQLVERDQERLRRRMYDVSQFVKTLKQRFTQRYNGQNGRCGTLWENRFKSILVEGRKAALATMAAYIDLNPVRARLVQDPKDYRWCGYAEALGGDATARQGLARVLERYGRSGAGGDWATVRTNYRLHLFGAGRQGAVDEEGRPLDRGLSREAVEKVLAEGGKLSSFELVRCRVRYFSDGVAFGTRDFVNTVFAANREHFGPKRKEGARHMRHGDWGELCTARDLRRDAIVPSPAVEA